MNRSNTLWILATCVVVISVIIYIINGINNETNLINDRSSDHTPIENNKQIINNDTPIAFSTIQNFYNDLISSTKVTSNDIGNISTFSNIVNNSGINELKKLYQLLKSKGFSESEIGSLDNFYTKIESFRVNSQKTISTVSNDKNINYNSYSEPASTISKYKGNQLIDGSSPLDGCFGYGVLNGNATLTIKNGSSSEAIVCLYGVSQGRTIRNVYVRKNSSYTIGSIAQGYYKIRVLYGNDWNPTLENRCGTKGYFESDVNFSEFDGQHFFEDSSDGYTVATITLYTVAGGNASTSKISESVFFNN